MTEVRYWKFSMDYQNDDPWDKDNIAANGITDFIMPVGPYTGDDYTGDGKVDIDLTGYTYDSDGNPDGFEADGQGVVEIDGVVFEGGSINSGTGNFNDFLGIQNTGTEFGFNTDSSDPSNPHIKTSGNFTHTITLADIAITTDPDTGVAYYDFRLDANENNSSLEEAQISLDTFTIFTSLDGNISDKPTLFNQNIAYDMDGAHTNDIYDVSIIITDAYSSGSGRSDLSVLIPVSYFDGMSKEDTYLYLYSEFGYADPVPDANGQGGYDNDYDTDATFEEWRTQNAVKLYGIKFRDSDGDGIADDGEGPVEGVVMKLFGDTNLNGVLDAGDQLLQTTQTDSNGEYQFYGIKVGATYFVQEEVPDGAILTTGDYETVVVSSSANPGTLYNVDPIGNFYTFDISGTKYLDSDGDGDTTGESGLGGVTIFIDVNDNGTYDAGTDEATTTAADGSWSFTGLDETYIGLDVYEVEPSGYSQTLGQAGYAIDADGATDMDFANFPLFDISGTKYLDSDGDGDTTDESGLGGVTIFIDVNDNATYDAGTDEATTTAADGSWSFTGLDETYIGLDVYEVEPSGYSQTLGQAGYAIDADGATDMDFANFPLFDISGTKYLDSDGDGD
ncbi:SdrD B-like domain-containing protein, partial [Croceicoccus sediminis]|uniref:SdrD B-like domain-containing protein n=1 Tax=Croceicoccus sediminis TaxID=2571150 RepID=UPI00196B02F8